MSQPLIIEIKPDLANVVQIYARKTGQSDEAAASELIQLGLSMIALRIEANRRKAK